MININEFQEEVVAAIKDYLPIEFADAKVTMTNKEEINTGKTLHGISVSKNSDERNQICPILYLDAAYEECDGILNEDILKRFADEIAYHAENPGFSVPDIMDYEKIKGAMVLNVVNAAANLRTFEERGICFRKEMDLLVYPVVILNNSSQGMASFKVCNSHLGYWNKTKEEIFETAMFNTENNTVVQDLYTMLCQMSPMFAAMAQPDDMPPIYVATSKHSIGGAAALLSKNIRERLAKCIGVDEYFIIPSSRHEILALPAEMDPMAIKEMICDVNASEVAESDVLSDHPYLVRNGEIVDIEAPEM